MLSRGEARAIGAALGNEHLRRAAADTGDGLQERNGLLRNGQARCELGVHPRAGRIQVLQMRELLAQQEEVVSLLSCSRPTTAWARASRLARSFPRANSASACASVSPASSRCRLSRAERPRTSVTTAASLLLASSRTACSRLVSRARSFERGDQVDTLAREVPQVALRRRRNEAGAQQAVA